MEYSYANVHRGLHTLANETTEAYEAPAPLPRGW
jgi:cysteine desulfurase/selenocysteine lyase